MKCNRCSFFVLMSFLFITSLSFAQVNGDIVILNDDFEGSTHVSISKSARSWWEEDIIVIVPNGIRATIVDKYQEKLIDGSLFERFKVKTNYDNKEFTGWVHDYDIKMGLSQTIADNEDNLKEDTISMQNESTVKENNIIFKVTRIIDGDTFEIENGEIVSLIGVNTSDFNEHYGKEASDFLKQAIEGKNIKLEFDIARHDVNGKLLAYAWRTNSINEEEFINESIISLGIGHVTFNPPNMKYYKRRLAAHSLATDLEIGLWDRKKMKKDLGEKEERKLSLELNERIISNLKTSQSWLISDIKKDLQDSYEEFMQMSKDGGVLKEIVENGDQLLAYIGNNFHSFETSQLEYVFESLVDIYKKSQGQEFDGKKVDVKKVLIYKDDEIIGSYDDNGLVFIK